MAHSAHFDSLEKAWLRRFHRWKGYATALTGSVTDAEEVIQEAVARTIRANPTLPSEADAHHYVLAAVRSVALQLFSHRSRVQSLEAEAERPTSRVASDPLALCLAAEAMERQEALVHRAYDALEELDPELRQAVELMVLREPPMKLRELAAIQGAPLSTVHSRLQSALRKLARNVSDQG